VNRSEDMDEFELELMQRMRRVDAPEGFALRVMEKAKVPARAKMLRFPAKPVMRAWMGGAIAAALAVGVFVGEQMHVRSQKQKQALAQQQFETAMRVTNDALNHTRAQLERAGFNLGVSLDLNSGK
jgi:hypothetical protein